MNRKRISTMLIIAGILLICIPLVGRLYMDYQQEKIYEEYQGALAKEFAELEKSFSEVAGESATEESLNPPEEPPGITGILGRIKIPAISVDLMLVEGTGSKQLQWGGGHVTGTAMPGETGNCSIAAHRDYTFGTYFSRLDELKPGDQIIIDYQGVDFNYTVTESFIVSPDEVSVLEPTKEPIVTLITCHPRGSGKQRLIVRGQLEL